MHILEAEQKAKDAMSEKEDMGGFMVLGTKGIALFKWLDPYLGFVEVIDEDGVMRTKDLMDHGIKEVIPMSTNDIEDYSKQEKD